MNRVLVTGSSGQLGMTLQELAPEYPELDFYFRDKTTLDITNADKVVETFQEIQPDYCINCAAFTQVDQAEKTPEPAYAVNVTGVVNIIRACIRQDTVLIHLSTDYVFDGKKEGGYFPDDQPNPINVYGRSKWEGEQLIQEQMDRYFIVRTSWLYSRIYGHNFYKTIMTRAKAGESLTVTDQERGCPTDTLNLARFLLDLTASNNKNYGIRHFTDGKVMTWYEFARKILIDEGFEDKVDLLRGEKYRTFAKRPENSILL